MFLHPNSDAHPTFSSRYTSGKQRSLVSLTPLIDVVFILLLFFMLATNFRYFNTIELNTPAAGTGTSSVAGALLIEVRLDGVRFAGRYMPLDQLMALVERRLDANPDRQVLVQPGAGVSLQRTVRVLDRLTSVGVTHLSLMQSPGSHRLLE